jgi:uncharacterized protein (DUF1778 family)
MRTAKPKEGTIKLRIDQSHKEQLQQAAMLLGVSVSDFIRTNSLAAANSLLTDCKQGD